MRYLKTLTMLVVTAAALTAFAGTASATITSGGSAYTGEIVATSTNSELDGTIDVRCDHSSLAGSTTAGATTFAVTSLTFSECTADTYTAIKNGSLRFDSNGTIFWEGTELTVQLHRVVFGFPITTHCIYATSGTDIATLAEGTDQINLIGTNIPQKATDSGCGSNAQWTGSYTIVKPGALTID